MKALMTGNEAVARGVWEAGAQFASAYRPSSWQPSRHSG